MTPPRVSVLLTSYEAGDHIAAAIQSVHDQTFTDWELLIFDDGSTDPRVTDALVEAALDGPRTTVRRYQPTAKQRAKTVRYATLLNHAARLARGEYFTFLCSDDYYLPDRLERMAERLDGLANDGDHSWRNAVVYGAQRLLFPDGAEGVRPADETLTDAYHRVDLNSVMVRRAAFDDVGGFPDTPPTPQLWREADAHLWRRLTDAGYLFIPVAGGPTDVKRYLPDSVDERVKAGLKPWVSA